jgi:hypothetical protein
MIKNATNSFPSTSIAPQTTVAGENKYGELDQLKKQLKNSELTITELKAIVEKLSLENSMLKTRIDSSLISQDVQL